MCGNNPWTFELMHIIMTGCTLLQVVLNGLSLSGWRWQADCWSVHRLGNLTAPGSCLASWFLARRTPVCAAQQIPCVCRQRRGARPHARAGGAPRARRAPHLPRNGMGTPHATSDTFAAYVAAPARLPRRGDDRCTVLLCHLRNPVERSARHLLLHQHVAFY
jgi:hypothetical protein